MANRDLIYDCFKSKMEAVGFQFEKKQKPFMQPKRGWELKFTHPQLVKKLREEGYTVRGEKFYIKPLSDESNKEVGLVNGKLSQLNNPHIFGFSNANDSFDKSPAWVNREEDQALDNLLSSIQNYLK